MTSSGLHQLKGLHDDSITEPSDVITVDTMSLPEKVHEQDQTHLVPTPYDTSSYFSPYVRVMFYAIGLTSLLADIVMFSVAVSSLNNKENILPQTWTGIIVFGISYTLLVVGAVTVIWLKHKFAPITPHIYDQSQPRVPAPDLSREVVNNPDLVRGDTKNFPLDIIINIYTIVAVFHCGIVIGISISTMSN
jgi:hypothetical protein